MISLPPEVDELTDEEGFDDTETLSSSVRDVAGRIEISVLYENHHDHREKDLSNKSKTRSFSESGSRKKVIWKTGKRLTINVDQVRIYRHRKCNETEIGTGSSDNGSLRDESSGFDRVQRRSNESRDGKKKESEVKRELEEKGLSFRNDQERKTQQGGPVRSRKGRGRNDNPYIEERTRSSNKNARRGGDQQRQDPERREACTKKSLSLEVLNNHDVQELWFQQDGATCHTARATIDLLKDTFGDRLISRFGPVNWPPRSCDLTPLDYFLWGYVKSLVYVDKPQTLDHLEDNIRRVIADIRPQMLEKVIENWTSRLDYILASRGSHMPEIIFKM
ncbi:transposable element Tc3 transposase [Trichonephila clavipes]|nr:transposable element Tc3 transposase [Trichonephila clavipes]